MWKKVKAYWAQKRALRAQEKHKRMVASVQEEMRLLVMKAQNTQDARTAFYALQRVRTLLDGANLKLAERDVDKLEWETCQAFLKQIEDEVVPYTSVIMRGLFIPNDQAGYHQPALQPLETYLMKKIQELHRCRARMVTLFPRLARENGGEDLVRYAGEATSVLEVSVLLMGRMAEAAFSKQAA